MNTLFMTGVGLVFSAALCVIVVAMWALGYGEPNVLTSEGETYLGWWMMLVGVSTAAFTIWGTIFDICGMIQCFFKKNA